MEDPASRKMTLKGYLKRQKAMPSGPDQASICDELRVRTCCPMAPVNRWNILDSKSVLKFHVFQAGKFGKRKDLETLMARFKDTLCQFKSRLKTHLFNLAYT